MIQSNTIFSVCDICRAHINIALKHNDRQMMSYLGVPSSYKLHYRSLWTQMDWFILPICLKGNWLCHIVFKCLHLYFSIIV